MARCISLSKPDLMEDEWKDRARKEVGFILANKFGRARWKMITEIDATEELREFYDFVDSKLASKPSRNKIFL